MIAPPYLEQSLVIDLAYQKITTDINYDAKFGITINLNPKNILMTNGVDIGLIIPYESYIHTLDTALNDYRLPGNMSLRKDKYGNFPKLELTKG